MAPIGSCVWMLGPLGVAPLGGSVLPSLWEEVCFVVTEARAVPGDQEVELSAPSPAHVYPHATSTARAKLLKSHEKVSGGGC